MIGQQLNNFPLRKTLLFLVSIIGITTITYWNHFHNSFHFDDAHTVENNFYIKDIHNIPLFFKDGTTFSALPQNQVYRPLVTASLAIDYYLGNGFDMFYFHLSSFILFLLQGILMFFLIFRLFEISYKSDWNFHIAAAASSWYLLHPANAETVNYVIARSDLQSTFFVVLGFVCYIFSPICRKTFLYLIPVIIGTFAKPTAVMFAPLLFCYIVLFEQKSGIFELLKKENHSKLWGAIKTSLPAFLVCGIMYYFISKMTPDTWNIGNISRYDYFISEPYVILHYFTTFLFPLGLSADTDWELQHSFMTTTFFIGVLFILFMLYVAFLFSKSEKLRPISFGILWFFIALLPTSSIIPLSEVLNDHRIYFPYVGLVISICWTIGLLLQKYRKYFSTNLKKYHTTILFVTLFLLASYANGVHQRNIVWTSEETLWKDVTIKSPKNARGLMNYGLSQMRKGAYPVAEECFSRALTMWPSYSFLHLNMAILKNATGDKIAAENYFKSSLTYGSPYPDSWFYYGRFLNEQHRYSEAIPLLEKCIELSASHLGGRSSLMKAYSEMGEWEKLGRLAQNTLMINPGNVEALSYMDAAKTKKGSLEIAEEDAKKEPTAEKYLNLSLNYDQKGDYVKCIEAANEALKIKPKFVEAYNNICFAEEMLGNYDAAIAAGQAALKIDPSYQMAKNNLAEAIKRKTQVDASLVLVQKSPNADNYINLSLLYYTYGSYQKAADAATKALSYNPKSDIAYNNVCSAYNMLKDWDKAIEAGEKGLRINPKNQLLINNLAASKAGKNSK